MEQPITKFEKVPNNYLVPDGSYSRKRTCSHCLYLRYKERRKSQKSRYYRAVTKPKRRERSRVEGPATYPPGVYECEENQG